MDLPKWNRARTKRKAPKGQEQDAFQKGVRDAGRTARQRGPLVAMLVVVAAGVIGGSIYLMGSRAQQAAAATRTLATAVAHEARAEIGDLESITTAIGGKPTNPVVADDAALTLAIESALTGVIEQGEEGPVLVSKLVRGARSLRAGDYAAAEAEYESFLRQAARSHSLWFLGQAGMAATLEAKGDTDTALAAYDELAGAKGSFYRDQALAQKGRLLEALGRKDDALTVYRQYAEEFPLSGASIARATVRARLTELDPDAVLAPTDPVVSEVAKAAP